MEFTKIQGTGNDFIYINCLQHDLETPEHLAKKICNRYYGVGADGIILVLPSKIADFKMKIYNKDGSEAEMCGNGIRGLGKYLYDNGYSNQTSLIIETLAGIKKIELKVHNNKVLLVKVDMGSPKLVYENNLPQVNIPLHFYKKTLYYTPVSMGNPHAVIFIKNLKNLDVEKFGKMVENHYDFENKTNVEFVEIVDEENIKMRVWERGVGETLGCGTGASASAVASHLLGHTTNNVFVKTKGGTVQINWNKNNNTVYLTGSVEKTFHGNYECGYV